MEYCKLSFYYFESFITPLRECRCFKNRLNDMQINT